MPTHGTTTEKGFFGSLFDFNFTSFITLRFLKVIYFILVLAILLGGVVIFLSSSTRGTGILFGLIAAPLLTLFGLVVVRISLESVAMFFRIGKNISELAGAAAVAGGASDAPVGSPLG